MTKDKKIVVYATTKNGQGYVTSLGEYDSVEEVTIHCGAFDKDVVITFEEGDEE